MFWRKQRAAIERFHPLHQGLVWQRTLSATLPAAEWAAVLNSTAQHATTVRRGKWRLPPRFESVVVPLIRVLSEDLGRKGTLGLTLDLRGAQGIPEKQGPTRELAVRRPIRSIKEWFLHDPWLTLRAELRDGSVLFVSVADRVRVRKIHKVNPRGKHKWKTKTKTVHRVNAVRRLPKHAGVRPAVRPPAGIAVKVRGDERLVIRSAAKLPAGPDDRALTDQILVVLTELFRWTPPGAGSRRPG